ncbi:hypothetical protein HHI36_009492 [Cryptolaemus montrouzieri]|uniref:Uncharacterized protein n=1 Tax=Cryptolaemus montrouzieri TaxID=559131 RepID=A0ABD2MFU9_9CUCU
MAQAFVTTYRNHYRWHKEPLRKSKRPLDRHAATAPPGDYWIDSTLRKQHKDINVPYAQALINQSTGRQMFSTYQVNYCADALRTKRRAMQKAVQLAAGEKTSESADQSFENELLKYCEELYNPKTTKLLPPTETTRRVHGYIRPESMYTPLTHYQMVYGRAGYNIMRNPMHYLNVQKEKDENSSFPLCLPSDVIERNAFKRCEELKTERRKKEKQEREKKLDKIIENLDRCTNYVNDDKTCSCGIFI